MRPRAKPARRERPRFQGLFDGRGWDRTSDLPRVKKSRATKPGSLFWPNQAENGPPRSLALRPKYRWGRQTHTHGRDDPVKPPPLPEGPRVRTAERLAALYKF